MKITNFDHTFTQRYRIISSPNSRVFHRLRRAVHPSGAFVETACGSFIAHRRVRRGWIVPYPSDVPNKRLCKNCARTNRQ